ncbi:MAG: Holliday junction branch migration protein RuvA [Proteobacteria bacterium]|nr:Holliday junction branch migration protein RuvA [Pseudomonadota bacterium]
MIGRLTGTLLHKEPPAMLVDVAGVGYEIEAPMATFYDLPAQGETVTLHTHLVVREDAHLLFGFSTGAQRSLFRSLIKVSGVGPRVALAVLSTLSVPEFALCVANNDIPALTRVPGIGKKTAERLIIEMRDKLANAEFATPAPASPGGPVLQADPTSEAVSALIALGYKPQEASRLVRSVPGADLSTEEIIRLALKSMAG